MRYCLVLMVLFLGACSTTPKKVVLDQSSKDVPDWIDNNKLVWEDDNIVFFKASHVVRGDERPNGCIDLAKLDAKENLLSEIKNEVKGSIDSAQQSISEDAEIILGKVRSSEFEGRISGLRFTETYWEKYQIGEIEQKVKCFALGQIKRADYVKTKRNVISKVAEVDSKLKEAITKKQIKFFENE